MENHFFEKYKTSEVTNTRRVINTPAPFTREHFFYIQEAGYLKSLRPHLSRRSGLVSYLFMVVLSGSGYVSCGDRRVCAAAGDCFFIDCRNPYTHISSEDNPWELMWLHFYGPEADAYYRCFLKNHDWHFHPANTEQLTNGIRSIIHYHEEKTDDTDLLTAQQIVSLLTAVCTDDQNHANADSALSEKLKNIRRYLDLHYTEAVSLDQLSARFFISKYYLSREFKKEFGVTIVQYVLAKKITNAKELLRYSNSSIEEIARLCGIDDASYFNKVFRKMEGCTASEYRRQW